MGALLAQALAISALVWGQPACGQPQVAWVHPQGLNPDQATGAAIFESPYLPRQGWPADQAPCTIDLNADTFRLMSRPTRDLRAFRRAMICTAVVHEWGHLTGHQHSHDPRNVMYPNISTPYWRCATNRPNYRFPVTVKLGPGT